MDAVFSFKLPSPISYVVAIVLYISVVLGAVIFVGEFVGFDVIYIPIVSAVVVGCFVGDDVVFGFDVVGIGVGGGSLQI